MSGKVRRFWEHVLQLVEILLHQKHFANGLKVTMMSASISAPILIICSLKKYDKNSFFC